MWHYHAIKCVQPNPAANLVTDDGEVRWLTGRDTRLSNNSQSFLADFRVSIGGTRQIGDVIRE